MGYQKVTQASTNVVKTMEQKTVARFHGQMRKVTKLLGPPGTGKTTALMAALEEVISRGVDPARIGFVSFSRKAIDVARGKAANQVPGADLSHFRTIHSTAYHLAGLDRNDVLQREHLIEFGELVGIPFTETTDDDLVLWEGTIGNRCLALAGLAAARNTSLRREWEKARLDDMPWELLARTVGAYEKFKMAHGLWDFNDMISKAEGQLDIDVLFVDEAQDTSASQWKLLRSITKNVKEIYLAGDDDQAVYAWSGADPTQLLNFRADSVTLPHSYRLPSSIKALADKLARRIRVRVPKDFTAREAQGRVSWVSEPDMIDLRKGKWMLLARSNYQLRALRELAQKQGVVYTLPNGEWSWNIPAVRGAQAYEKLRKGQSITPRELRSMVPFLHEKPTVDARRETYMWQDVFTHDRSMTWLLGLPLIPLRDREYIRSLRRNGESLSEEGRVVISTVHGIKGEEADNVVMLTDISDKVNKASQVDPDAELRVQYVGVTRARESLTLVQPKSQYFWDF